MTIPNPTKSQNYNVQKHKLCFAYDGFTDRNAF